MSLLSFPERWPAWVGTVFCILASISPRLPAKDWNQFRGPEGNGHAVDADVPLRWSAEENVRWKVAVPGKGWSSPVVSGSRIFLTTAVPVSVDEPASGGPAADAGQPVTGQKEDAAAQPTDPPSAEPPVSAHQLMVVCLDVASGRTEWSREVFRQPADAPAGHRKNSHASPTPIVSGDRIFVHFGHQGTACLTQQGQIVWKNTELRYDPVHGNGGSPILVHDLLVFSCDAASDPFVVALDASTGAVRWKVPRDTDAEKKFSFSTPTAIEVDGVQQIVSPGSNAVCAYDPRDGAELWRVRYEGYSVVPKPLYHQGLVFISTSFDSPQIMAIRAAGARGDVTDTHLVWRADRGAPNTPSFLIDQDLLFMVSDGGVASCLNTSDGKQLWQKRLGGGYSASPLLVKDRIYFLSEDGVTHVVRAASEYESLAENHVGERTLASMAVADDSLLIRTESSLLRIQGRTE